MPNKGGTVIVQRSEIGGKGFGILGVEAAGKASRESRVDDRTETARAGGRLLLAFGTNCATVQLPFRASGHAAKGPRPQAGEDPMQP